ncbi:hypothetical protein ACQ5SO_15180 [Rhodovulum sp. DZ06]|uniref:hypothetical protein n=1 Tax=Rhodovulum sp. DZ06 TaxID=3425126 RepID=UPI003D33F4F0
MFLLRFAVNLVIGALAAALIAAPYIVMAAAHAERGTDATQPPAYGIALMVCAAAWALFTLLYTAFSGRVLRALGRGLILSGVSALFLPLLPVAFAADIAAFDLADMEGDGVVWILAAGGSLLSWFLVIAIAWIPVLLGVVLVLAARDAPPVPRREG